jgi:hypothetical protein
MPARRNDAVRGFVAVDAAIVRRHAQRAADIGAERQRAEAGSQRRRGAAGRTARRAGEIPRIVGGAVNVVEALPVGEHQRHIGLAENDSAGALEPGDRECVLLRHKALGRHYAPGRRQAGDVERFLDGDRYAKQRTVLTAAERGVGSLGGLAGAVEVAHHDGVDFLIERLDAGDDVIGELDRGNFSRLERAGNLFGRAVVPLGRRDRGGGLRESLGGPRVR